MYWRLWSKFLIIVTIFLVEKLIFKNFKKIVLNLTCEIYFFKFVFCKKCLQGYHVGDCEPQAQSSGSNFESGYVVDPLKAKDVSHLFALKLIHYSVIIIF